MQFDRGGGHLGVRRASYSIFFPCIAVTINYQLVINLRVAKELTLNVPNDLLLRADEVIR